MTTKTCSKCLTDLPIEQFGLTKKLGKSYRKAVCKACYNEISMLRRKEANEKKRLEGYEAEAKACPCDKCPSRTTCQIFCNDYKRYLSSR